MITKRKIEKKKMNTQFFITIFEIILIILFIGTVVVARKLFSKQELQFQEESKFTGIEKILNRFFENDKAFKEKENFKQIELLKKQIESDIQKETVKRVAKTEEVLKYTDFEEQTIEQAGKLYSSFSIDFKSAMPRNEKERDKDMNDLMDAVKILEGFDQDHYKKSETETSDDMGKGMFIDRIVTKLGKIIKKEQLNKQDYLIFDKIVYLGLKNISNITRKDLFDSVRYLKDVGYIKDFIEINPQLLIITQTDEKIKFTNPEKVVLAFAQDEEILTLPRLIEKAKWSEDYAKKIIKGLQNKKFAEFIDDVITIKGFETREEKKLRWALEEEIRKKEEEKNKQRTEHHDKLEQEYEQKKKQMIETPIIASSKEKATSSSKFDEILDSESAEEKAKAILKKAEEDAKADSVKKFKLPEIKTLPSVQSPPKAPILPQSKPSIPTNETEVPQAEKSIRLIETKEKKIPKPAKEVDLSKEKLIGVDEDFITLFDEEPAPDTVKEIQDGPKSDEKTIKKKEEKSKDLEMEELLKAVDLVEKASKKSKPKSQLKEPIATDDTDFIEISSSDEKTKDTQLDDLNFDDIIGAEADAVENAEVGEEAIIDGIMSIYEKYEHITGGLLDLRFIHQLLTELYPDITLVEVASVRNSLKSMGLLKEEIQIEDLVLWILKDIKIDEDMQQFIAEIDKHGPQIKEKLMLELKWEQSKIESVINKLKELDIIKIDKDKKIIVTGLFVEK